MKLKKLCDQPHSKWHEYIYHKYYPNSQHNSKHMFDVYSLTHTFWSFFLFVALRTILPKINFKITDFQLAMLVFVFTTYFEIHENEEEQIVKYRRIEINENGESSYRGDTMINILGDITSNSIGIYLGYILSNGLSSYIIPVLLLLFGLITKIVGMGYWIEFFQFLS